MPTHTTAKTIKPAYMDDYVTKADLKEALSGQTTEFAQIVHDLGDRIAEKMQSGKAELKADIQNLRTDMHEVKAELQIQSVAFSRMAYALDGFLILYKHPSLGQNNQQ